MPVRRPFGIYPREKFTSIFFIDRALSGISLAVIPAGHISRTADAFRFWRDDEQMQAARGERERVGQNPGVESMYAVTQKTAVRFLARRSTKRETDDDGEDATAGTKAGSFLLYLRQSGHITGGRQNHRLSQ